MKKIVVLALAVSLLLAACGSPKTDQPAPPARSHEATYRDSRYGYFFTYDDSLFAVAHKPVPPGNGQVNLVFGHPPKAALGVWVTSNKDTPGRSIEDALNAFAAYGAQHYPGFQSGPAHETRLAGRPALRMSFTSNTMEPGIIILMHHAGLEYEVQLTARTEDALRASLPAIGHVLESFRIRH